MSRILILVCILVSWTANAQTSSLDQVVNQLESKPYVIPNPNTESNQNIYKKYCTGSADSYKTPAPKYDNSLVKSAAIILRQTKDDADVRLEELFKDNWKINIETIKENLTNLKSSTNPLVAKLAEQMDSTLSEENVGFTDQQKKLYETMIDSSYVDVKNSLSSLDNVVAEFKGVDYNKLKTLVIELNKKLVVELKSVDINKLRSLALSLQPYVEAESKKTVDANLIINGFKVIQAEFKTLGSKIQELSWTVDSLDYYVKQLEADPNNLEGIQYGISEVSYYFTADFLNNYPEVKYSAEAIEQNNKLLTQYGALTAKESLTTLSELVVAIDDYLNGNANDLYSIRWPAQTLESNLKIVGNNSSDAAFKATLKALSNEVLAFDTAQTLQSVKNIEAQLVDADPSNDSSAASSAQYLNYDMERLKDYLSAAAVNFYSQVYAESSKVNQENIKETLQSVKDMAAVSDANEFINQGGWQVSDLSSSLEAQKPDLSASAQAAIDSFVSVAQVFSEVQNLSYYMSTDFELKKSNHYYFYGQVKNLYKVNSGNAPYGRLAHTFLVQLCGEYRDRASMIEAKLKWIQSLYTLPKEQTVTSIDFQKNIWAQMSAEDYYPFLQVTEALWHARKEFKGSYITVGQYTTVDTPIEGPTVCETKYIFEKYVKQKKEFDDLDTYLSDFENNYRSLCSKSDQEDYYDFRGDSNFKHYSPESNAMIWKATSIARACKSTSEAKFFSGEGNNYSDEDCKNYFEKPFYYRYNAARSSLAAGLFYDPQFDDSFDSLGDLPVTIHTQMYPQLAPMPFETETSGGISYMFDPNWLGLKQWNQSDIGFNDYTGLGSGNVNVELAYERIRGSVDRHTNWYAAGYNDDNGVVKDQAFSPFVASSYVMQASDAFTTCGITVQCPPDGLKRWMFIFRVKAQNWYNPQRILDGDPVDFDKMWFDETSFGDSGLANGESAWDRLGTAMEEELDSILYLINVDGGGYGGEYEGEYGDEAYVDGADFE